MKADKTFLALVNGVKEHGETACMRTDPEAWFPQPGDAYGDTRRAKAFCQVCPVQRECLEFALVNDEQYGIWGGMTLKERLAIKSNNRRGRRKTT